MTKPPDDALGRYADNGRAAAHAADAADGSPSWVSEFADFLLSPIAALSDAPATLAQIPCLLRAVQRRCAFMEHSVQALIDGRPL